VRYYYHENVLRKEKRETNIKHYSNEFLRNFFRVRKENAKKLNGKKKVENWSRYTRTHTKATNYTIVTCVVSHKAVGLTQVVPTWGVTGMLRQARFGLKKSPSAKGIQEAVGQFERGSTDRVCRGCDVQAAEESTLIGRRQRRHQAATTTASSWLHCPGI
jgi:hypothetical protein